MVRRRPDIGRSTSARALAAAAALAIAGAALADEPRLIRLDQGFDDADMLATSLRNLQPDLRQDLGFEHLYTDAADPTRFVRVSGGTYVVSPRTDYAWTRDEVFAVVSPGTVFYIGAPPEVETPPTNASQPGGLALCLATPMRTPLSQTTRPPGGVALAHSTTTTASDLAPRTVLREDEPAHDMSNDSYRVARLRQIARSIAPR